jgi:hypothetical protein
VLPFETILYYDQGELKKEIKKIDLDYQYSIKHSVIMN